MIEILILSLIVAAWIVLGFSKEKKPVVSQSPRKAPRRKRHRSTNHGGYGKPHGLPWMDPKYQKWLRKQKLKDNFKF